MLANCLCNINGLCDTDQSKLYNSYVALVTMKATIGVGFMFFIKTFPGLNAGRWVDYYHYALYTL